jgi:hypothetical protein
VYVMVASNDNPMTKVERSRHSTGRDNMASLLNFDLSRREGALGLQGSKPLPRRLKKIARLDESAHFDAVENGHARAVGRKSLAPGNKPSALDLTRSVCRHPVIHPSLAREQREAEAKTADSVLLTATVTEILLLAERAMEPPIRIELMTFSLRVSSDGIIWAWFGSSSLISRGWIDHCDNSD